MVKRSVFSPMLGTDWIVYIILLLRRASNMANRKQFISIAIMNPNLPKGGVQNTIWKCEQACLILISHLYRKMSKTRLTSTYIEMAKHNTKKKIVDQWPAYWFFKSQCSVAAYSKFNSGPAIVQGFLSPLMGTSNGGRICPIHELVPGLV